VHEAGRTLGHRLVFWGVLITWVVGGVVGIEGTADHPDGAARGRGRVRTRCASRAGSSRRGRALAAGGDEASCSPERRRPARPALASSSARRGRRGRSGFVLLDRGLSLAAGRLEPATVLRSMPCGAAGVNRLPINQRHHLRRRREQSRPWRRHALRARREDRNNVVTATGSGGRHSGSEQVARTCSDGSGVERPGPGARRWTIASYAPIRSIAAR